MSLMLGNYDMNMNIDGSRFNVSDSISIYSKPPSKKGKDSPTRQLFESNQRSSSSSPNSMEIYEEKQFVVIKREEQLDNEFSMDVEGLVKVKNEPNLETSTKLLEMNQVKERIIGINPHFNGKEKGVENCLPCVISFYNWILSGSEFPEEVDPYAKPEHEHMFASNGPANLLQDAFTEKLHNPKVVHELDEHGKVKEYICLTEDLPLTFQPVLLKDLRKKIERESDNEGVAWKQYEKGGETFKLGILFLNFRKNKSRAHFLAFQYRLEPTSQKYILYIIDPQSKSIDTFDTFFKDFKKSYADKIYMWTGQNSINYDCNKSPTEIFESFNKLKSENQNQADEVGSLESEVARIESIAKNTKLKITLKRPTKEIVEPEFSKKAKKKSHSGLAINNQSPETPKENPWAPLAQSHPQSFPSASEEKEEANWMDQDRIDQDTMPGRKPLNWNSSQEDISETDFSSDSDIPSLNNDIGIGTRLDDVNLLFESDVPLNQFSFDKAGEYCNEGLKYFNGIGVDKDLTKAFNCFKLAADLDHTESQYSVGFLYSTGQGVDKNLTKAFTYYKMAADNGSKLAQEALLKMYEEGQIVNIHLAAAVFGYNSLAAQQGDANAEFNLGLMYCEDKGIQQDFVEAVKYYKRAAEQGHVFASVNLADIYYSGKEGVPQNLEAASLYYKRAADKGDVTAQGKLGRMYYDRLHFSNLNTLDKNLLTLYTTFNSKPAADKGYAVAQGTMGAIYYNQNNFSEAFKYAKPAADKEDALGQYILGNLYRYGHGVTKEDPKEAFRYFKMAADQGNVNAMETVGHLYFTGKGVPQNFTEAFKYNESAALQGSLTAQSNLGMMYLEGKGVKEDPNEAVRYLKRAADQGDENAAFNLGMTYLKGNGVDKNFVEAVKFLKLSAAQGNPLASYSLAMIYYKGEEGVQQNFGEAFIYFKKAADKNNEFSRGYVGRMYYVGKGTVIDYRQAFNYSKQVADKGNAMAQGTLGMMHKEGKFSLSGTPEALGYILMGAQSDVVTQRFLGEIYKQGKVLNKNLVESFRYFKLAADQGDSEAQYNVGLMYWEGEGVNPDLVEAEKYLKLAADQGHLLAQNKLGK